MPDGGAIVMAVAALEVLELTERIAERLDPSTFVPAVGQGCVAVECRADDSATAELLAAIDHAADAPRGRGRAGFLAELGSGCSLPVGAHVDGDELHAFLAGHDDTAHERIALALDAGDHERAREAARHARRVVGW